MDLALVFCGGTILYRPLILAVADNAPDCIVLGRISTEPIVRNAF